MPRAINGKKICSKCKIEHDISFFHKGSKASFDKLSSWCKNCTSIRDCGKLYRGSNGDFKRKSPEFEDGTKLCSKCNIRKLLKDFYINEKGKYRASCNRCEAIGSKVYKYSITINQYEQMLSDQNSRCKICKCILMEGVNLHLDHSHDDLKVRGLLCSNCNVGLGMFQDNPDLLIEAFKYLDNSKKES